MNDKHEPVELTALTEHVKQAFQQQFDRTPSVVVAAPGRVNMIGEHIDYNDGFVMPMAIDRYVVVAADRADPPSTTARLHSTMLGSTERLDLKAALKPGDLGWSRYAAGVLAGFQQRGVSPPGFDALVASSVPLGGGLSSSAALEVAFATLLCELTGERLSKRDRALLCQKAEHDFAGVPCGIMDQFSSVFGEHGRLLLIDCKSEEVELVPLDATDVTVLITNSNVKHELSVGQYAQRRGQCDSALSTIGKTSWRSVTREDVDDAAKSMSAVELRRAKHVVSEIARTVAAADCLRNSNWEAAGELMNDSHASLRDDFEVSCAELNSLTRIAAEIGLEGGVYGSRMTGGGFGGSTVTLVMRQRAGDIIQTLSDRYQAETGIAADCFASRPARGAHVVWNG